MIPYLYLGLSVVSAATGSGFLVCRFDPFVGFFRMNASFDMLVLGASFLLLGMFVARPYCRFLCPYGILLRWTSLISRIHVRITPDRCVRCRLCENSCPFGAIRKPNTPEPDPTGNAPQTGAPQQDLGGAGFEMRKGEIRRLALLIVLIPLVVMLSGFTGSRLNETLSRLHPTVRVAERVQREDRGLVEDTTLESRTFRELSRPTDELQKEAEMIRRQFVGGGWALGLFLGAAFCFKVLTLTVFRRREFYEPDPSHCLSCGRCFAACPREQLRRRSPAGKQVRQPHGAHA
jgi:ferredoxin